MYKRQVQAQGFNVGVRLQSRENDTKGKLVALTTNSMVEIEITDDKHTCSCAALLDGYVVVNDEKEAPS